MKFKNIIPFLFIIVLFFTNVFSEEIIGQVTGPSLSLYSFETFTINYDGWYTNSQYFSGSEQTSKQSGDLGWYTVNIDTPASYDAQNITFTPYRPGFRFEPVNRNYTWLHDITDNVNFVAVDTVETTVEHIAPTGTWVVNVENTIKFRVDDNSEWVAEYRFFYSTDNGNNYTPICTVHTSSSSEKIANGTLNPSSTKGQAFTPTVISDEYILKFEAVDADGNVGIGYSPVFSVIDTTDPSVTVTSPNGSEVWYIDSTHNITWTATDNCNVTSRAIDFYNGSSWSVLDNAAGNTWTWTIPNAPSAQCLIRVRVYDQSGNIDTDISDAAFEIMETPDVFDPVVSVTAPTAEQSLKCTTNYDITWTATDNLGVEKISFYLSTDNGSTFFKLDSLTSNPGTWPWRTPINESPSSVIKIYAYDAAGNRGENSSGTFSINSIIDVTPPTVTVLEPVKGQAFNAGASIITKVEASDDFNPGWISYYLSLDGGNTYTFKDSIPCPSNPATISKYFSTGFSTISDQCKLKVILYDKTGNHSISYSDSLFRMIDNRDPYITFEFSTFPPDTISSGSQHTVDWLSADEGGITYILLSLSTDNGTTFTRVDSIGPELSYLWTIPQTGAPNCLISAHAYDAAGNVGRDTSEVFTIKYIDNVSPTVTLDPVQNVIQTDIEYEITWTANDNVGISYILILLSTDSGSTYNKLDSVSPVSSYLWTAPSMNSPGCCFKLQVFDAAGNTAEAESNLFNVLLPVSIKQIAVPKKFGVRVTAQSIIIGMEKTARVSMSIYTLNGRLLFSKNEILSAGYHRFSRISAHGIYILRIKRSDKKLVRKLY